MVFLLIPSIEHVLVISSCRVMSAITILSAMVMVGKSIDNFSIKLLKIRFTSSMYDCHYSSVSTNCWSISSIQLDFSPLSFGSLSFSSSNRMVDSILL